MALSYFIHNAILTILKSQKNPEKNSRDLLIGYILVASCYVIIGVSLFIAFPMKRECISDNFLNNIDSGDTLGIVARIFLLLQMFSVMPLLVYLIRVQFSYVFTGTSYPGVFYVILVNLGIVVVATGFAIAYPKVGNILRYVGSASGFIYVFTLPCLVHLKKLKLQGKYSRFQLVIHFFIILLGFINVLLQFFV